MSQNCGKSSRDIAWRATSCDFEVLVTILQDSLIRPRKESAAP
jgi:hypothetical protein